MMRVVKVFENERSVRVRESASVIALSNINLFVGIYSWRSL